MREMLNNKLLVLFQNKILMCKFSYYGWFANIHFCWNKGSKGEELMVAKINLHIIIAVALVRNLIITFSENCTAMQ